jgi:cytoskeleton protein RodZ
MAARPLHPRQDEEAFSVPSDQDQQEPYLEQPPLEGGGHFSVGRQLREVRETYDLEIEDVATALRIRPFYLQAIEETRYESLPGTTYAIGFVRAYAEYLRLDPKELVERFKAEVSGLETRRSLQFPVPAQEGRVPGVALLLVAVLLAAVGYGVWYYVGQEGEIFTELVEPLPEDLAALVETEEPAAPEQAAEPGEPATPAPAVTTDEAAPNGGLVEPLPEGLPAPDAPIDPDAPVGSSDAANRQSTPPDAVTPPETLEEPEAMAEVTTEADPLPEAPEPEAPAQEAAPEADPAADLLAQDQTGALQPAPEPAEPLGSQDVLPDSETVEPAIADSATADSAITDSATGDSAAGEAASLPAPLPPERSEEAGDLPEGRVYGAVNENARVVLLAESDSWVEVRDRGGRLILSRVLRRGDSYKVPPRSDLVMMTGNAGGLAVTLDGQRLPGLGEQGQVRRDIPLEPDALKAELGQ